MLLKQLEYLVAVAREQHFGRAAASCWVSQPTLSDAISRLEAETGCMLVRRGRRFEGLTPEGDRLATWARRVLAERDELMADLRGVTAGLSGQLRIATVPTAVPPLPALASEFNRSHPNVTFDMTTTSADEIVRLLTTYQVDVGVTYVDRHRQDKRLITTALYEERYVLATPDEALRTLGRPVTWAEAADLPLCLLSAQMHNRRIIDECFRANGVTVIPQVEADSLAVLASMLETGQWSSVVSELWLKKHGRPVGTTIVPLERQPVVGTIGLVALARDPLPALTRTVMALAVRLDVEKHWSQMDHSQGTVVPLRARSTR